MYTYTYSYLSIYRDRYVSPCGWSGTLCVSLLCSSPLPGEGLALQEPSLMGT